MKLTTRNKFDLAQAAQIVATLPAEKQWRVEVTELKARRSLAQNRLLWAIYTAISNATGHTTEEIHEACKAKFLEPKVIALGKEAVTVSGSTAQQERPEFSDYVEKVCAWASQEFGLVV